MTDISNVQLNYSGVIVGSSVFIIIVIARWLCIWGEYNFTKKFWIFFLIIGLIGVFSSLFTNNILSSAILSASGFIFLWGINETIEQEERVKKGWFKKRDSRK
jgi:MFS-type transporter involved in bile tolerance (Atg22 family)